MFQFHGHRAGHKVTSTDPPAKLIDQLQAAGPEWAQKISVSWFWMK